MEGKRSFSVLASHERLIIGEASLIVPDRGSYLVTVLSNHGYRCSRSIDMDEFTRAWEFVPGQCVFRTDRYAYVESTSTRSDPGLGFWFEDMERERATFREGVLDSLPRKR